MIFSILYPTSSISAVINQVLRCRINTLQFIKKRKNKNDKPDKYQNIMNLEDIKGVIKQVSNTW